MGGSTYIDMLKSLRKESATDNLRHVEFDISIEIDPLVYQKVMHWVNKSDFEVSGLGTVVHDKERNVLRVVDAILLKQENSSVETELDGQAISRAMYQTKDSPGSLRWWWHSHVNMDVFWSGTDMTAIKTLGGAERDRPAWFCMTVFNKKQEMLSAYVQNSPVRMIASDLETTIASQLPAELIAEWDKQYDDNVENKKYVWVSKDDDDDDSPWTQRPFWDKDKAEAQADADEEEEDEEYITLDDLFLAHERGEIDDQEFFAAAAEVHYESAQDDYGLTDEDDLLTDEEASQMDIVALAGRTRDDDDVPLI